MNEKTKLTDQIRRIPIDQIVTGGNDRKTFPEQSIKKLADSILIHGQIVPVIVNKIPRKLFTEQKYDLVAGERRYRACQFNNQTHIDAVVRDLTTNEASSQMLIENTGREQLRPIEEAEAYRRRIGRNNATVISLASAAGVSRETIRKRINLLALPEWVQHLVNLGTPNGIPLWVAEEVHGMKPETIDRAIQAYINNPSPINRNQWAKFCDKVKADEVAFDFGNTDSPDLELKSATPVRRLDAVTIDGIRLLLNGFDKRHIFFKNLDEKAKIERVREWLKTK